VTPRSKTAAAAAAAAATAAATTLRLIEDSTVGAHD